MKRSIALVAFCFVLMSLISFIPRVFSQNYSNLERLVKGNTLFAIDLYKRIKTEKGNIIFSPYSISTALAVTYGGARENTAKQMADVLHFTLEDEKLHSAFAEIQTKLNAIRQDKKIQIGIVNSLWPQVKYPFLKEYLKLAKTLYKTEITLVDYTIDPEIIRLKINSWVKRKTNNRIKDIIPDTKPPLLNQDTTLVIINAIYFKGEWAIQFEKSTTTEMPFHPRKNETIVVSMMHQTSDLNYGDDDILQVLEMPYAGNELSMLIALPREIDGLQSLEEMLTVDSLTQWSKNLHERPVDVYLPRFRVTYPIRLHDVLKEMGMEDAFVFCKANFSGMDGIPYWLHLDFVLHKAFIDVNEEGTEAAAATAVGCFPYGTEVLTDSGRRSIETVDVGTKVHGFDPTTGEWTIAKILKRQSFLYKGDMITIHINHDSIQATGNQPFYVLRGDQLASRPLPQDVPEDQQRATKYGRWVEARDLKEGDVLQNKNDEGLIITSLSSRQEKTQVYCLEVDRYHNCAVHRLGILAHNGGKKEAKASPTVFRADHPFLFMIKDNIAGSILFMGRVSNPSTN